MKLQLPPYWFVFDVESIGLHGDSFAVGWTVIDPSGEELDFGLLQTPARLVAGTGEDREWVEANVPTLASCLGKLGRAYAVDGIPQVMRQQFWHQWISWSTRGAKLVADCGWPVEARFLAKCVDDRPDHKWKGPYPLHEIASFCLAAGLDPLAANEPSTIPHNPLEDARASARLLQRCLAILAQ